MILAASRIAADPQGFVLLFVLLAIPFVLVAMAGRRAREDEIQARIDRAKAAKPGEWR